jgi:hypothetical protein
MNIKFLFLLPLLLSSLQIVTSNNKHNVNFQNQSITGNHIIQPQEEIYSRQNSRSSSKPKQSYISWWRSLWGNNSSIPKEAHANLEYTSCITATALPDAVRATPAINFITQEEAQELITAAIEETRKKLMMKKMILLLQEFI